MKCRYNLKQFFTALLFSAFCLPMFAFSLKAQSLKDANSDDASKEENRTTTVRSKISPDLEKESNDLMYGLRADETQAVIIQLKSETPLNEMFGNALDEAAQTQLLAREARNNKDKARR